MHTVRGRCLRKLFNMTISHTKYFQLLWLTNARIAQLHPGCARTLTKAVQLYMGNSKLRKDNNIDSFNTAHATSNMHVQISISSRYYYNYCNFKLKLTLIAVSPHFSTAARPCEWTWFSNLSLSSSKPFGTRDTSRNILDKSAKPKPTINVHRLNNNIIMMSL